MKKFLTTVTLMLTAALPITNQAQETRRTENAQAVSATPNEADDAPVFDDDGGRVFVVRRKQASLDNLRHHGGQVISSPQQYSIFVGSAWANAATKARVSTLSNLFSALDDTTERRALERYGVKNSFLPPLGQQELLDYKEQAITDLRVHALLAKMFESGTLGEPAEQVVYVLFLAPGIRSTLGSMIGGKHYAAYHNFFHIKGAQIRYVVVPFEADSATAQAVARRALIEAAVNPAGNGWY